MGWGWSPPAILSRVLSTTFALLIRSRPRQRRRGRLGSLSPAGDEQVGVARLPVGAVGGPHEPAAVRAEHRKAVEAGGRRDPLRLAALRGDHLEVELAAAL